jgi:hypothetical protein
VSAALQRLCKWRAVFAGWQLGTRPKGDPESDAVRDHRELTILLRAEVSALVAMLVGKGVFTAEEFCAALDKEAEQLSKDYEQRFPGFKARDYGMHMDAAIAADTMRGWRK